MDYIKGAILGVVLTILLIGYVRLIAYLEKTLAGAKEHRKRADNPALIGDDGEYPYRRSFNFLSPTFPKDFFEWMVHCKIPREEATDLLRSFANTVAKIMEKGNPNGVARTG